VLSFPVTPGQDELFYDPVLAAKLLKRGTSAREKARALKVNKILEVAIRVFSEEGVQGFSTRKIAGNAGITLSTLQHYFGTRDNLLIITINSLVARYISNYVEIARNMEIEPARRFDLVVDDLFTAISDPVIGAFYAQLWAASIHEEAVRSLVRESYTKYYEAFTMIVSAMRPDLPLERATALSLAIGSQIDGLLVTRIIAPHSIPAWPIVMRNSKSMWRNNIQSERANL
jgi:AcrR family transcriptional regulator